MFPKARHRVWLLRILLLLAIAGSAWAAAHLAAHHDQQRQMRQGHNELQLRMQTLRRLIERYRVLPTVLALDPELRRAVAMPRNQVDVAALNLKLDRANGATRASTLTLIGKDGVAIAANNWREPSSNVGLDYGFRPYFQLAMREGRGSFYAVGVSTLVPGYYISEAIRDDAGENVGVVVVKITLDELKQEWMRSDDTILLSDEYGIVFMSNDRAWDYRMLGPLSAQERDSLEDTRQYGDARLTPAQSVDIARLSPDDRRVRIEQPPMAGGYLWQSLRLPDNGWTLHVLSEDRSRSVAVAAAAITAVCWLPLILLGLFLQQRARHARQQEHSRLELERLIAHHAEALRSAQDGLVQAAKQAALGEDSLEHLPQGVSVVDADLRLVNWNTRYQEIFGFPPGLLVKGRPIEDIFRYNAQRGWFGGGADVEKAIRRRLRHLRGSGSYMHEREHAGGTVLEIHGNPLPGGGFVTSYADITAYKAAARDLRTLATTLEHRIEASTRDLRTAKSAAENANRYKARFIAAAVHDLLQPLNAARMYLGALRARSNDSNGDQGEIIARAERALESQDMLLSSMLDLSRLEAGVLEPVIEAVPLAPMLDELATQFSILARNRGLALRMVPCRASVRSDATLLRRVLQNLLSNAIQYTRSGRVLIGCRRDGGHIRIEVWDTGVGIAESRREEIFEEFRRLDSGVDRDDRSAGLGLSIVDRVARLLGHGIGLRSWPGRGSVFSITVPRAEPSSPVAPATAVELKSPLHGRRVWCVDDDPEVLHAMRALLESWGCKVTTADGSDALGVAAGTEPPPDLVLIDYHIGDAIGPELLAPLRRRWGRLPGVIVISASPPPGLRERLIADGFRFLSKPVAPASLRALMTQLSIAARASR